MRICPYFLHTTQSPTFQLHHNNRMIVVETTQNIIIITHCAGKNKAWPRPQHGMKKTSCQFHQNARRVQLSPPTAAAPSPQKPPGCCSPFHDTPCFHKAIWNITTSTSQLLHHHPQNTNMTTMLHNLPKPKQTIHPDSPNAACTNAHLEQNRHFRE
jgi:hypothetical protein